MSGVNIRLPGVKRLLREAKEMKNPTCDYYAQPLDDNIFEWHFTIRGPPGSAYESGIYHGRIVFPNEYPMKPPSIIFLTPNGRFHVDKRICLSVSPYHPEEWQPSWGVRTMLLALIGFFPTPPEGAIGSADVSDIERKRLAQVSNLWKCSACKHCNKDILPLPDKEHDSNILKEAEIIKNKIYLNSKEVSPEKQETEESLKDAQTQKEYSSSTIKICQPTIKINSSSSVPRLDRTFLQPLSPWSSCSVTLTPNILKTIAPELKNSCELSTTNFEMVLPMYDWLTEVKSNTSNSNSPSLDSNSENQQNRNIQPEINRFTHKQQDLIRRSRTVSYHVWSLITIIALLFQIFCLACRFVMLLYFLYSFL